MKKILFSLAALVCSMSMNAQVMKVMKNGVEVAKYTGADYTVVFEEEPLGMTGTAKRTGDVEVAWVQLWEDGPRFAEYNVGAANNKAEDCGGLYCWGGSIDKDPNRACNNGYDALTGTDDTATNLWGSAWRMPTIAELEALIANCDVEWTDNYKETGVMGKVFTGRGDYASNSVFLPAAGFYNNGSVNFQDRGYYRSSMANSLVVTSNQQYMASGPRNYGYSVRAVLAK